MVSTTNVRHPAPFPRYILDRLALHIGAEARALGRPAHVLDPFAGIGRIHDLPKRIAVTVGVELEPEWAEQRAATIVGDATKLPEAWTGKFDVLATSPVYGNRASDHHEARDACRVCDGIGAAWTEEGCPDAPMVCPACHSVACACGTFASVLRAHNGTCHDCRERICTACRGTGLTLRHTYRHALGRMPTEGSASVMQWPSQAYKDLHEKAWAEGRRVLRPGGLALINVKNHIRDHQEQDVVGWHARTLATAGFCVEDVALVPAKGMLQGANRGARVSNECIIVARTKEV